MEASHSATEALDETRLRRLHAAGRARVSQLELEAVLDGLLETARELTGARYAALGILDSERTGLPLPESERRRPVA